MVASLRFALRRHTPLHLFRRNVFHTGSNSPPVPEWILDGAIAIAIKLVLERFEYLGSPRDGFFISRIYIGDMNKKPHGGIAEGLWTDGLHLGVFIGQHDDRVTDLQLRVSDASIGLRHGMRRISVAAKACS
jgi:hypothetical protein